LRRIREAMKLLFGAALLLWIGVSAARAWF
jgi:hypothetical protein